jgi:uncharacterized protein YcfL
MRKQINKNKHQEVMMNKQAVIKSIEAEQAKTGLPDFRHDPGRERGDSRRHR